ncbi:hypothetical protein [Streptomyces sioyaensis]
MDEVVAECGRVEQRSRLLPAPGGDLLRARDVSVLRAGL